QEIAPRLNRMGFNCLAVDLRSGQEINGVANETAKRARTNKLSTTYLDAQQDIESALLYARKQLTLGTVLAWGSSYSASLVLQISGEQPLIADGVLAFAPGEYFPTRGEGWVAKSAADIRVPVFITSAKEEAKNWKGILDSIGSLKKTSYIPETEGHHGSSALWRKYKDSPGYWKAVTPFLTEFLPKEGETPAANETGEVEETPKPAPEKEKDKPKEPPRVE
ncbi:MAG: hypothetical protein KDB61_11295, partial [Planctomycetes bacterium]|nr:hypothetical protein [Planctomycetota bacterium]